MDLHDPTEYDIVEVSFKDGARKDFFHKNPQVNAITGDLIVVESKSGYDIGRISLSGELVRLQMKKKRINEDRVIHQVLRIANHRDMERLDEARSREKETMIRARAIARSFDLNMKVGDVEYQGDNRKATFYYTADGRVDFRELVRSYAKEFRVKIEMRQIGSRQESARIGGLGPCGRELCCSTWLSDFKSVSTSAARYQNLAINQTKLSGQCGRLKCCLNYELDSYIDALADFPKRADVLRTEYHKYELIKTDIFKGIMYYIQILERGRGPVVAVDKSRVKEVLALNKKKEYPTELGAKDIANIATEKDDYDFEDINEVVELPNPSKRKGRRKNSRNSKSKKNFGGRREDRKKRDGGDRPQRSTKSKSDSKRGDRKKAEKGNQESSSKGSGKKSNFKRKPNKNRNRKDEPK